MFRGLEKARELLEVHRNDCVHIVSHIDADGLSSAAILSKALEREGIEHWISCLKLSELQTVEPAPLTIFSDLGSGQLQTLSRFVDSDFVILDHHPCTDAHFARLAHVNPTRDGYDGTSEISGSGVSYFFARSLSEENKDLSSVAIVGAVGDLQDSGRLKGLNRIILEDASSTDLIEYEDDLVIYGRATRPLHKALQYFSDPYIPGVTGSESQSLAFLASLGVEIREGEWLTLADLSKEQKRRIASEMVARSLPYVPPELARFIPSLIIGESLTLKREEKRSPLRDASEFSTCLNACGRNGRFQTGIAVAKGARDGNLADMLGILQTHRETLRSALALSSSRPPEKRKELQVFCAEGIDEAIVGTVASMLLSQNGFEPYLPIVGYTSIDENTYKISARCSRLLAFGSIHLGRAIRRAAEHVGGEGGGHAPACGAYIRKEKLAEFLDMFERQLAQDKGGRK